MSGKFLSQFFRQAPLGPDVVSLVLETFHSDYGSSLSQNSSLGEAGLLVGKALGAGGWVGQLEAYNHFALDYVLASDITDAAVWWAVVDSWILSDTAQQRVLELSLEQGELRRVAMRMDHTQRVLDFIRETFHSDISRHRPHVYATKDQNVPRLSYARLADLEWKRIDTGKSVYELGYLISGLYPYCQFIIEMLGNGASVASRDAWTVFFGLAEDDPQIGLAYIVDAATTLAKVA